MAQVQIHDLDIRFGEVSVIEKLHLDIADGEFLVLLGPSGCGKSTLLHSIAGLIDVHDGQLSIGGRDVTWADPKDRGIGMVFQSYALYPTMTVERNMSFGLRISGVDPAVIRQRVQRAAEMLHLTELLQRKPAQLSGGQRQRVAIGRALVREAGVFLFDEPLSNLDAKLRGELRRELKQLHKSLGATMVYVTHDQIEAMTLATRIAVMKGGRIQQIDTPAQVYARPSNMFVAGFLGSPSMNFIDGRLQAADGSVRFASSVLTLDLGAYAFTAPTGAERPAVLGVRPEAWGLVAPDDVRAVARGRIGLVEPMGAHQVLWLEVAGVSVAVHAEATVAAPEGSEVGLSVDPAGVSVFDATSQQRL